MNGMLPNQEISRLLAQDHDREVRQLSRQRSLLAMARTAQAEERRVLEARRTRLARLAIAHPGQLTRMLATMAAPVGLLATIVLVGSTI